VTIALIVFALVNTLLRSFATLGLCLSTGFHSPHHLIVRVLSALTHQHVLGPARHSSP
jgi:hypothetical protein